MLGDTEINMCLRVCFAGLQSGMVHEARCGTAQTRPGALPAAAPLGRCTAGPVRVRALREQRLPEGRAAEVRAADEGRIPELAGDQRRQKHRRLAR